MFVYLRVKFFTLKCKFDLTLSVIYLNGVGAILHTLAGAIFLILILSPQSLVLNKKVKSEKFPAIFKSSSSKAKLIREISPIAIDYENVIFCSKPSSSLLNLLDRRFDDSSGGDDFLTSKSTENALDDGGDFKETKFLLACFMQREKSSKRHCLCFSHASVYFGLSTAILSIVAGFVQIIFWSMSFSYDYYYMKVLYQYCALGFSVFLTVMWLISGLFLWIFMSANWPFEFVYNNKIVDHFYEPPTTWRIAACLFLLPAIFLVLQIIHAIWFHDEKKVKTSIPQPSPANPPSERADSQPKNRRKRASARRRNDADSSATAANDASDVFVVEDAGCGGQSAPIAVNFNESANKLIFRSELKMACCRRSASSSSAAAACRSENLEERPADDQKLETPPKATAAYYTFQNPFFRPRYQNEGDVYDGLRTESMPDQSVIFANPSPCSVQISKAPTENDVNSTIFATPVGSQFAESVQSTSASTETMSSAGAASGKTPMI